MYSSVSSANPWAIHTLLNVQRLPRHKLDNNVIVNNISSNQSAYSLLWMHQKIFYPSFPLKYAYIYGERTNLVEFLPLFIRQTTSSLPVCYPKAFWNGVYSKRIEFAPMGSKFFPFRVDPFLEEKEKQPWQICPPPPIPLNSHSPLRAYQSSIKWFKSGRASIYPLTTLICSKIHLY